MLLIQSLPHLVIGSTTLVLTFITMVNLVTLLSTQHTTPTIPGEHSTTIWNNRTKDITDPDHSIKKSVYSDLHIISMDISLILLFIFQHSAMKRLNLTQFLNDMKLSHLQRSVYVILTDLSLLLLINSWQTSPTIIWQLPTTLTISWTLTLIHCVSWYNIYFANLMFDIPDLLGLRQIAEFCTKNKTSVDPSLTRLYSHMRHPSFSCLLLVLITRSTMSLDRLLLAALLSVYMYLAWSPDIEDLRYRNRQWDWKQKELQKDKNKKVCSKQV